MPKGLSGTVVGAYGASDGGIAWACAQTNARIARPSFRMIYMLDSSIDEAAASLSSLDVYQGLTLYV
jgi:hypothetical protein